MSEAGQRLTLTVSDPWEFVDGDGSNVFTAEVMDTDGTALLLLFAEPVKRGDQEWRWFVAVQKHPEAHGEVSLFGVTEEVRQSAWADAARAWRGESPVARARLTRR